MATLALSLAGQAVGGLVAGPFGAMAGRALGALAGNQLDNQLFGRGRTAEAGHDVRLLGSHEGGTIPRLYGWSRVTGNIIWATELVRLDETNSGAKGLFGPPQQNTEPVIVANFALGLCEGEVAHIGRVWADGQVLETAGLTIRKYLGSQTQLPDSLIAAKQGSDGAPAYRGLCYLVFERLPLTQFGNRIPQLSVEICWPVGDLEPRITAVTVIPGATEYGYDPEPRMRIISPGTSAGENTHLQAQTTNWTLSMDELQALCPNLQHVALVVSWFGTDLRCGQCRIEPRVEGRTKNVSGTPWLVDGIGREAANEVTTVNGGPAYGGTPSDDAVLAAIADLKARGLSVTIYPLVMMDIAADNALVDPYTGSNGQPAYPWRGRITCDPAPGVTGTPDQTAAAGMQIAGFVGADEDFGYRRFVLHYAGLCAQAGGVDAFVLGSELRGLTTIRDATASFPFVAALQTLASDVRAVLGSGTKLTYAADWSEYSGYQPPSAPGDKLFHLDPLWADPAIDAVGIDNYMPIADWRDGDHQDAAGAASIYESDYLQSNIAGGEGYDWFYSSQADRLAGIRTPVTDGAYGEPWVYRFKDIVSWWSNVHHNRIDGVRSATPTAWVPEGKPVWLTELGCAAVDKGANLPSAFPDPKSSEDKNPYFSAGTPDPLMQRQFLRAHLSHWQPDGEDFVAASNPVSSVYSGRMLDPDRIYLWTWDARPYPAFPAMSDVWSDGPNHMTGHWLTGRLGAASSDELITVMARDFGLDVAEVAVSPPLVQGLMVETTVSLRDATETLLSSLELTLRDTPDGLSFISTRQGASAALDPQTFIGELTPVLIAKRAGAGELSGQLAYVYGERLRSYRQSGVTAVALDGDGHTNITANLVLDDAGARRAAANMLARARFEDDTLDFALPPSLLAYEPGDLVTIAGRRDGPAYIASIRDDIYRRVSAVSLPPEMSAAVHGQQTEESGEGVPAKASPVVVAAHLPSASEQPGPTRLAIGAFAVPWPGTIAITESATGSEIASLSRSAVLGLTQSVLPADKGDVWSRQTTLDVEIYGGHLSSVTKAEARDGANRLLVEHVDGSWEVVGFASAELTAPRTYTLSGLLRGLEGTGPIASDLPAGSRALRRDSAVAVLDAPDGALGAVYALKGYAGPRDMSGTDVTAQLGLAAASPLAPCHLQATRSLGGDIAFSWVRRSRQSGNSWVLTEIPLDAAPERYRLSILNAGEPVRVIETTAPQTTYAALDQIADFGLLPPSFSFQIQQISAVFGPGLTAQGVFND